jgi:hypothetical protein
LTNNRLKGEGIKMLPLSFQRWIISGLLLAGWINGAHAALLQVAPTRDNTIYSDRTGNSNGQGVDLSTGTTDSGGIRRALLHFDVSSIPAGSQQGAAAQTGDATWLRSLFDTVSWTAPGGDFVAASSAATSVGTELIAYQWTGAGLAADVQGWVDGTFDNHGWLLRGEETLSTIRRFGSLQNVDSNLRPLLTVVYTVPEPSGLVLAVLAVGGGCFMRRCGHRSAGMKN